MYLWLPLAITPPVIVVVVVVIVVVAVVVVGTYFPDVPNKLLWLQEVECSNPGNNNCFFALN